jgi:sugar porter (SP) family MFS transporter
MLLSGYQTVVQFCALIGFWSAFVSHAIFAGTSPYQWELPVGIQLLPGVLLLLGTFFIPETPRYLTLQGQDEDAEEALSWLRRLPLKDPTLLAELQEVQEATRACEKLQRRNFFAEASKPDVRRRLFLGMGLMVSQNMSGLNALNYYAPALFQLAGFTSVSSCLFLTGIFGLTRLTSAVAFMSYFVHTKGNRFWLQLGSALCGITMIVLAYFSKVARPPDQMLNEVKLTVGGIISILMVYFYAFCFGLSLGPIPWNICSEIFPLHINAECCAVTTCTHWLFQIVTAAVTPYLLASIGWATYLLFGICCFISQIWVYFYMPETKGVPVGRQMDELFGADLDDVDQAVVEVLETTPLIKHERRRRSSLATYV